MTKRKSRYWLGIGVVSNCQPVGKRLRTTGLLLPFDTDYVRVDTLDTLIMLTPRRAEGREFDPRPGQYSRMSFSSDQVTGTVFPHLNMPFLPNSEFI